MIWERIDKPKLIFGVIGTALWLFAPFATINIFSFSEPPAAVEYLYKTPFYMDSIFENPLFWVSLLMGLPAITGLITSFTKTHLITNIFAIIALSTTIGYAALICLEAQTLTLFTNLFGYGYWLLGLADFFLIFCTVNDMYYETVSDKPPVAIKAPSSDISEDTFPSAASIVKSEEIDLDKTQEDFNTNKLFVGIQKQFIYTDANNQRVLIIDSKNDYLQYSSSHKPY